MWENTEKQWISLKFDRFKLGLQTMVASVYILMLYRACPIWSWAVPCTACHGLCGGFLMGSWCRTVISMGSWQVAELLMAQESWSCLVQPLGSAGYCLWFLFMMGSWSDLDQVMVLMWSLIRDWGCTAAINGIAVRSWWNHNRLLMLYHGHWWGPTVDQQQAMRGPVATSRCDVS
jgi:hypothetical protein